ncbi:hypothetical protein OF117_08720 [Geodermatophilus sp. YIM 151500]|uniref:hypothetical protein n=1 Tax=Geodermatophilus sp. YIM 151500 TaxID=2984531 RepID=UPI0021E510AD|nr:hypothetical protein [Geodermatophilus sp. YIM 151500]MCV2489450.1 hypothetical protein [Geodermatophilus sp. YIM 151500]
MVLDLMDGRSATDPGAVRNFRMRMAAALVRALQERRRILAVAELNVLDDEDAEGSIVGSGWEFPVAPAVTGHAWPGGQAGTVIVVGLGHRTQGHRHRTDRQAGPAHQRASSLCPLLLWSE